MEKISEGAIKTAFAQAVRTIPELHEQVSKLAANSRRSFVQMVVYLVEIGIKNYREV